MCCRTGTPGHFSVSTFKMLHLSVSPSSFTLTVSLPLVTERHIQTDAQCTVLPAHVNTFELVASVDACRAKIKYIQELKRRCTRAQANAGVELVLMLLIKGAVMQSVSELCTHPSSSLTRGFNENPLEGISAIRFFLPSHLRSLQF